MVDPSKFRSLKGHAHPGPVLPSVRSVHADWMGTHESCALTSNARCRGDISGLQRQTESALTRHEETWILSLVHDSAWVSLFIHVDAEVYWTQPLL